MKHPSRKFMDLIHQASSKWANWDPPSQIQVGDYGIVNRKTGLFEKDGNIYDDGLVEELAAKHPLEIGSPEDYWIISSSNVKRKELTVGPGIGVEGLAEAIIKGQWVFGNKRGALLIMARPCSTYMPKGTFLKHLVNIPALKDKSLVTQVVSCPAYSLYLSNTKNDVIDIALIGSIPLPVVPGISAGVESKATWWTQFSTGLLRDACNDDGANSYTPLYTLKEIRKPGLLRREGYIPVYEGDDLWVKTEKPWDPLDEDGEEELFEDTVFD